MKTESFKGTIESAYGQTLPQAIKFAGEFDAYETLDEVPEKDKLSDSDILKVINDSRKANARQKSMNEALNAAGIEKPTLENSVDLQVKNMVKSLVASGKYNTETATSFAKQVLGVE
jgi:hypothetical protein